MVELTKCPFCGGKAKLICFELYNADEEEEYETYSIECTECGVTTAFMSKENVIECWERREGK